MDLIRVFCRQGEVFNAIAFQVTGAGAGSGASKYQGVVYADDGSGYFPVLGQAPLAATAVNLSATVGSTGLKSLALASAWTCPADDFYWIGVAVQFSGTWTTYPTFMTIAQAPFVTPGGLDATNFNGRGLAVANANPVTGVGALSNANISKNATPMNMGLQRSA